MSEGTRIQFDDAIHPVVSQSGGVYNLRERAGSGSGNFRAPSLTRQTSKEYDLEKEVSNVEERDIRKKQVRNFYPGHCRRFLMRYRCFPGGI